MARSTTAFGISEIILDGRRDFNTFGSHDSTSHLRFRHFHSSPRLARDYLKEERNCDICGVEITDGAFSITEHPFKKSTTFLLGNKGIGLSAKEYEICDFFVYIPQYDCGTASLNVTVATSIVLHHFGGATMCRIYEMYLKTKKLKMLINENEQKYCVSLWTKNVKFVFSNLDL
ncbi:hypothetical protein Cni_G03986 [Canna indica]|uniref:tRNA/rRNA methyltransferase SpoU type domain-containing protein n=1 Tax=Canna indica TaxID=4628 RepID=A0AAQ3JUL3_9LILI|nr:hypothetical protein Cni_G03986 [Canna indica]